MKRPNGSLPERVLFLLLVLWMIALHLAFLASAGPLWRDEANSIHQAQLPSLTDLWNSLSYDSFPLLYPLILRLWSSHSASDMGMRLFGLLVGLAALATVLAVARLLGSRQPVVAVALLAATPGIVVEGDAIRPYGLSVLFLLWTFGLLARGSQKPSVRWLAPAVLAAVASVQLSYANCIFLAVFTLAILVARRPRRPTDWRLLLPAALAFVTLLPYGGVLRRIRDWSGLLDYRRARDSIWTQFVQFDTAAVALWSAWGLAVVFAAWSATRKDSDEGDPSIRNYAATAALVSLAAQLSFLWVMGLWPFPRYFLPCLALGAFACESLVRGSKQRISLCIAIVILSSAPAFAQVTTRRSNMAWVSREVARQANSTDLVLVSPWFLHTSFQRYYHGRAPWTTVPSLERSPLIRYDLILQAMLTDPRATGVRARIAETIERRGSIWLVSQRRPEADLPRAAEPELAPPLDGLDYMRCRNYWEREIEMDLVECCTIEVAASPDTAVSREESLVLTRWKRR